MKRSTSQKRLMNWRLYFLVLLLATIWCSLLMGFPWLVRSGHAGLAATLFAFCSSICHQDPSRSFHILGVALPVCSRCTAVYFGSLGGVFLFPLTHNLAGLSRKISYLMGISTMLLALDVAGDVAGLRHNTFLSRSMSGGFLGLTCSVGVLALVLKRGPCKPSDAQ